MTTGSSAAFNLAFLAMFDPGDRVAIAAPGYPAYRNIMTALGLEVVEIELAGAAYLHAEHLREAHAEGPLKGVLFASPANPTGAVIPSDDLKELVGTAQDLGIAVISDEIYHRLAYSAPDVTALSFGPDVTVINSFSKYYCMTGWRIGWMVLPERLVRPVERIAQSLYISPPEISQIAAIEAFSATAELEAVKARYAWNRELLLRRLPKLGFALAAPMDGAFYAFCDVSKLTNDSMAFARGCLRRRTWRRRRGATSIRSPAIATCGFPMPAAMTTWCWRWIASNAGCDSSGAASSASYARRQVKRTVEQYQSFADGPSSGQMSD